MGKKNKRKKEEIAEDWCFVCKDGGLLMLCEYRDCLKAYHTDCVGKDDSFLESGKLSACSWHYCFLCCKTSKFQCFCCPTAVCGRCFCDAEFSVIKGNKGFCSQCLKLARLVEENTDVDSDGDKIDFKDPETYEFLFSEYYYIIKEKEGWNSLQVHSAYKLLKNGQNYKCDGDQNEIVGGEYNDTGESDDESDFVVSDYDDLNVTAAIKSVTKQKIHSTKLKSIKGKVKDKKKEFIGWGSRSLIGFLDYTGRDTNKVFSQRDVASVIIEYCKENKLFHPEKKKKVLCDAKLKALLGRKSVNKNSIYNLLTPHFSDNLEESEDDIISSSEDRDENKLVKCRRQKTLSPSAESHEEIVSEEDQSCLAAIVTSNLKLVYLKRSLIEELLTQPETFDSKVMGSFVRVKSDPNDYLQKNSHQLLQVVGIKRSSKNDENNKEIMLHLSNVPIDVPISKISDDDFSEEECQDLHQRMKNGLLLQPTVLELEQKARSLHEDIIKHWIPRELALLQRRIDQANEKGWRRELYEYMDLKLLLQTQSEQSRVLQDIPRVISEVYNKLSQEPEDSPKKDKSVKNGKLVLGQALSPLGNYSKGTSLNNGTDTAAPKNTAVRDQDGRTTSASIEQSFVTAFVQDESTLSRKQLPSTSQVRQVNSKDVIFEELTFKPLNCNTTKCGISQLRHTDSGSGFYGRKLDAVINFEQIIKEKQTTSVADPIMLSSEDEQDANVPVRKQAVESAEISIWHCMGPYGERRGPFSLSLLKRWSESTSNASKFKVWKTGESETNAIFLIDALRQNI